MFKERLKQLREEKGLTQKQLAEMLNISRSALSLYESGQRQPDLEILSKIARFFNVTVDYLIGGSSRTLQQLETIKIGKLLQIPIIGCVKAGEGGIAYEELLGYEYIDADMIKDCENCFFLRVKGNSMEPEIKEGDLALVRRQPDVPSNTLAVVIINGEEGMIKKIVKQENAIVLQSYNPEYSPIVLTSKNDFRIVGQVISILRKFVY